MAVKTFNIDSMVRNAIHKPSVEGKPLYARADNCQEVSFDGKRTTSEKWEKAVKTVYTSPNNIRRIFVTLEGVYTERYCSVVGREKDGLKRFHSWGKDELDGYNSFRDLYNDYLNRNVIIRGTGLKAIVHPWVCSNLEEFYFGFWTDDYLGMGLHNKWLPGKGLPYEALELSELFKDVCCNGNNDVYSRFPRFKAIGYCNMLSELYGYSKQVQQSDKLRDLATCWCAQEPILNVLKDNKNKQLASALYLFDGVNKLCTSFSLRSGIYVFDRDKLNTFAEWLKNKGREKNNASKEPSSYEDRQVEKSTDTTEQNNNSARYDRTRKMLEDIVLNCWSDLYSNHINGLEVIEGLVVPSGAIQSDSGNEKHQGILKVTRNHTTVAKNTLCNGLYEEFIGACEEVNLPVVKTCGSNEKSLNPFTYNPLLQKKIASGEVDYSAYSKGWESYRETLRAVISPSLKSIAKIRDETGDDKEVYNKLSSYLMSMVIVNYKDGLGMQLRVSCGYQAKTKEFSQAFIRRIKAREKSNRSFNFGKMRFGEPQMSPNGSSFILTLYINRNAYYAIPDFMGELLVKMTPGMFKPSVDNMIIGTDLQNRIVTAPFNRSWLIPIIAGSRSGKGVLTLNMLLNIIGTGTPLFYLDGKPDMAVLLWKLQEKHGIHHAMVIDGIKQHGTSDVSQEDFQAPYYDKVKAALVDTEGESIIKRNINLFIYLKTMMVILLSCVYYKDVMKVSYGDLFVVYDELFAVITKQIGNFKKTLDTEIKKLDSKEKERKAELQNIQNWIASVLSTYITNDIGVFAQGIKAVALAQKESVTEYNVEGFREAGSFAGNFLLKRAIKIFGRQDSGGGTYGVKSSKDSNLNDLYQQFYHFGIAESTIELTRDDLRTFKPLLVLNENDSVEVKSAQGLPADKDGKFIDTMMKRIRNHVDENEFRNKYFRQNTQLAAAIGFEGALEQIGRLIGEDWVKMLNTSLSRSYEIANEALKYFGIIGVDNIIDVYDYICSSRTSILWDYNRIVEAQISGKSLGRNNSMYEAQESVFSSIGNEEFISDEPEKREPTFKTPESKPVISNMSFNKQMFKMTDKKVFVNYVTEGTETYNGQNSIDCSSAWDGTMNWWERMAAETPRGAEIFANKLWKSILKSILNQGIRRENVTRVTIVGGNLIINNKMVLLNGVIGGTEDIRLQDIVNFKLLFKEFPRLKELTIDSDILLSCVVELGQVPEDLFKMYPSLLVLYIVQPDGRVEKATVLDVSKARNNRDFSMACAIKKNKKWKDDNVGTKIWGAKLAKCSFSTMAKELARKNNPSVIRALAFGVLGVGIGTIGISAYGAFQGLRSLMSMFRH